MIGAALGGILLLRTPETTFYRAVPYLLTFATIVFAASPWLRRSGTTGDARGRVATLTPLFGGRGVRRLLRRRHRHHDPGPLRRRRRRWQSRAMNALKNFLTFFINGAAVIPFAIAHAIVVAAALVMAVGAVGGAYGGRAHHPAPAAQCRARDRDRDRCRHARSTFSSALNVPTTSDGNPDEIRVRATIGVAFGDGTAFSSGETNRDTQFHHSSERSRVAIALISAPTAAFAGVFVGVDLGIGISVNVAPPPIPVYVQPPVLVADDVWTPGYWAYGSYG